MLLDWGITLPDHTEQIGARVLEPQTFIFGGNTAKKLTTGFQQNVKDHGMYQPAQMTNWVVIHDQQSDAEVGALRTYM